MTESNPVPRNKTTNNSSKTGSHLHILHQFPEFIAPNTSAGSQKQDYHDHKASSQAKNNNKSSRSSSFERFPSNRREGGSNSSNWRAPEDVNTTSKQNSSNTAYQPPIPTLYENKGTRETKSTQTPYQHGYKAYDRRDNKHVPEKGENDKTAPSKPANAWGTASTNTPTPSAWSMVPTPAPNVWESKKAPGVAPSEQSGAVEDVPPLLHNHDNPRVILRFLVLKLVHSKLISEEVENALQEYIHSQKIPQEAKDICTMEEQQQVDALNSIAKKYPYDAGNYAHASGNSPIQARAESKSWLQQKVEEELGPNVPYLITGPDIWNRLGLDTTNLYTYDLIYTTNVEKEVEGLRLRFKKVNFELPSLPTPREWFVVDMCNNIQDMDITVQEFTARLRRLVADGRFDPELLQQYSGKFGNPQTCEIIKDALLSYIHQSAEFADFIRETAARYHARDVAILRDYLITHVLYALQRSGHKVFLKGGCSLSLGYNLITRTSEDVDLRIDPSDGVMWEVNGKNPLAAENSRMAYFLNLIDSMLIEDGDVKLYHTKCKTTQAVYHVTFNFPRIHHTPIAIVLEVMHKVAPFYEQCAISSKVHDFISSNYPEKFAKFKPNNAFYVSCSHPMQTLYEKIHAVYQNYQKFKRNDGANINAAKWIRHLGDAYIIIKHNKIPLPADWPIDQLQKELAKSGDFVVDLTLDHPVLNHDTMDSTYHAQIVDAYDKHLQDAYYGEVRPPNDLQEVCTAILEWLRDKPIDFMSYRVNNRRNYNNNHNNNGNNNYKKHFNNNYSNNGNSTYNKSHLNHKVTNMTSTYVPRNYNNSTQQNNKNNRKHAYRIDHQQQDHNNGVGDSNTSSDATTTTTNDNSTTNNFHSNDVTVLSQ